MKAKVLNPYFDISLNRNVEKDEVIEVTEERKEELKSKGINLEIQDEVIEVTEKKRGK